MFHLALRVFVVIKQLDYLLLFVRSQSWGCARAFNLQTSEEYMVTLSNKAPSQGGDYRSTRGKDVLENADCLLAVLSERVVMW